MKVVSLGTYLKPANTYSRLRLYTYIQVLTGAAKALLIVEVQLNPKRSAFQDILIMISGVNSKLLAEMVEAN